MSEQIIMNTKTGKITSLDHTQIKDGWFIVQNYTPKNDLFWSIFMSRKLEIWKRIKYVYYCIFSFHYRKKYNYRRDGHCHVWHCDKIIKIPKDVIPYYWYKENDFISRSFNIKN